MFITRQWNYLARLICVSRCFLNSLATRDAQLLWSVIRWLSFVAIPWSFIISQAILIIIIEYTTFGSQTSFFRFVDVIKMVYLDMVISRHHPQGNAYLNLDILSSHSPCLLHAMLWNHFYITKYHINPLLKGNGVEILNESVHSRWATIRMMQCREETPIK